MMKWLVMLACCLVAAKAITMIQVQIAEWDLFKLQYAKTYDNPTEEQFRLKIYNENKHLIAIHNQHFEKGEANFSMEMNKFGDLLSREFTSMVNGYKMVNITSDTHGSKYISPSNVVVPDAVDWTKKGYVTPVKNQGDCGSCWAFSTTGSLEGQHFKATGKLVSLSEQQLVDCSSNEEYGNMGCVGGEMNTSFAYIKNNKGLDDEASYPYTGKDIAKCHFDPSKIGATDTGYVNLPVGDEEKLKEAVATIGPISIAIDASTVSFEFYKKGVYYDDECSNTSLNHGVLVVGYGNDAKGGDYWLVKNSWGVQWGDEGYIRIARNRNNLCGVATQAIYPLV